MKYNTRNEKEIVKKQRNFSKLLIIIYVLAFIIYVAKPICFDVRIYIDAAIRADRLGVFPYNIFGAWEHKYILNRLLFYIIFKIASLFTSANNIILFELIVKIIYGILAVGVIKYFSESTSVFFSKYKINKRMVFGILYFIIMGSGISFHMQTEMTAFFLTLLAITFVLKEKWIYKIISAFIISMLFWFKGVTLLYAVIILIVMLLNTNSKKKIIFVICWSWIFLLAQILLLYYIEPKEINNIYLATKYFSDIKNVRPLIDLVMSWSSYNILWIGFFAFIINIIYHIKFRNIKLFILESFTWIILFFGVYIQKLVHIYQLGLMVLAIAFSVFIFLYYMKNKDIHEINYQHKYLFVLMLYIIIIVTIINVAVEIDLSIKIYKNQINSIKQLSILEEQLPDLKEEKVLYIGNGLSSYYIRADSYTGYTTTIFLANNNKIYNNSKYIEELKNTIKSYDGKYIIIDELEFINKFRVSDDIIEFIEKKYHYKQDTNISIYEYISDKENESSIIYEKNN